MRISSVLQVAVIFVALTGCGAAFGATLTGRVVAIADGDTLTVLVDRRQIKARLADIDAPERKQPFGTRSRLSLAGLCFGKRATIDDSHHDRYGRVVSTVSCAGADANTEQVRRGMAWVFERYARRDSALYGLQEGAKAMRTGLWADEDPIAPWEWRPEQRGRY